MTLEYPPFIMGVINEEEEGVREPYCSRRCKRQNSNKFVPSGPLKFFFFLSNIFQSRPP